MKDAYNIADLREIARKRMPRGIFEFIEFIDRGAEDEVALRRNRTAFDSITLRSRPLRRPPGRWWAWCGAPGKTCGRRLNAPGAYDSHGWMSMDPVLDAVCVATPSRLHAEQAIAVARAIRLQRLLRRRARP